MKQTILMVFTVLVAVFGIGLASAQNPYTPPTILQFSSDVPAIALADAEAGAITTTLAWRITNLRVEDRLVLQHLQADQWVDVVSPEMLIEQTSLETVIAHSLSFAPPSYRLLIADGQNQIVSQQYLTIPYTTIADDITPFIESIFSQTEAIDAEQVGNTDVILTWSISNRLPDTNLLFEQVLADGSTQNIEKPRATLWIPSSGTGNVRPVAVSTRTVVIRLSVIDIATETRYDTADIEIPIGGEIASPTIDPTPTALPVTATISNLAVNELAPRAGQDITIAWSSDAASVNIEIQAGDGQVLSLGDALPSTGETTVTMPEGNYYLADVVLTADDTTREVELTMQCPTPYFFDPFLPPSEVMCPISEARGVYAVNQLFEFGTMIWRSDTREIFIIYDNFTYEVYPDTYQEGENLGITEQPPEGLRAPVRGFGKVWAQNPMVQQALGWAESLEAPYTMQFQTSDVSLIKPIYLYLTLLDGRLIFLTREEDTSAGAWGYAGVVR